MLTAALGVALLSASLQPGSAVEVEATHAEAPHSDGTVAGGEPHGVESAHEEDLHAANAILFLFVALTVGIILRRAVTGFIIPYTGLLVVRFGSP